MELNFKEFIEGSFGLNQPGRAGQHVWKPETPPIGDDSFRMPTPDKSKKLKGTSLNSGFRPLPPQSFKGITADQFGIKTTKIPKPKS